MKDSNIPKLGETDGTSFDEKIIHQMWFEPQSHFWWLIAEYDPEDDIAFGFANLDSDMNAEWGHIPISEIRGIGAVQDDKWKPVKFPEGKQMAKNRASAAFSNSQKTGSGSDLDGTENEIRRLFFRIIELQKEKSICKEYHDSTSDEEVLGIAISNYVEWDGERIFQIAKSAFEDSNFRQFNSEFEDLWNANVDDVQAHIKKRDS